MSAFSRGRKPRRGVIRAECREEPGLNQLDQGVQLERMDLHRSGGQQQQAVDELLQLVSEPVRLRRPGLGCALQ